MIDFKRINLFSVIIALLFCLAETEAKAEKYSAEIDVKTAEIGDRICLTLRAETNQKVIFPEISDTLGLCSVTGKSLVDTLTRGGNRTLTKKIYLTAFQAGETIIPSFTFFSDNGNSLLPHYTVAIPVRITSPDISKMKDIMPEKSILAEDKSVWDYWPWYLLGIIALAAFFIIRYYVKKHKAQPAEILEPAKREIPKIAPEEWLLREIDSLSVRRLWLENDQKTHFSALTDAVKRYIELKFSCEAMELTTDEIAEKQINGFSPEKKAVLLEVLRHADLVKFAKLRPGEAECLEILEKAKSIL